MARLVAVKGRVGLEKEAVESGLEEEDGAAGAGMGSPVGRSMGLSASGVDSDIFGGLERNGGLYQGEV